MTENIKCTFCGAERADVNQMIMGPSTLDQKIHVCDECVTTMADIIKEDVLLKTESISSTNLTPSQIKVTLDEHVIGQDLAKKAICVAMYNHHKRTTRDLSSVKTVIEKSNILMIGPSGSGKTLMVNTIAKLFNLPMVIADATTLTESGYVGEDVESIIESLYSKSDSDLELAQRGVVFLDEIDKIGRKSESSTVSRDVSGEGVQQSLLKLIEGTTVKISVDGDDIEFDTANVLFIASGAFVGLGDNVVNAMGFTQTAKTVLVEDVSEELCSFGLIPEFIGRLPVVVKLHSLNESDLVKVIREPKNNALSQYEALFALDGVTLEFKTSFIKHVAKQCIARKTGARAIRSILEHTLQNTQFELPDLAKKGVHKIVVSNENTIKNVMKRRKNAE